MEFGGSRGQSVNGNHTTSSSTILGWDVWELNNNNNNNNNTTTTNNSSRSMDWATTTTTATTSLGNAAFYGCDAESLSLQPARAEEGSHALALLNPPRGYGQATEHHHAHQQPAILYGGGGARHSHPDPHLVCLKLGKRHYFEDHVAAAMAAAAAAAASGERRAAEGFPLAVQKRGKGGGAAAAAGGTSGLYGGGGSAAAVPRCQVEGCHVALVNAKDYHRRHKVCEMHSKAPKVVVLGLEQRFCQQCSRFHVVSEFEETKRSCKRRLAGHNERRRKSSHDSIARNSSLNENKLVMMGGGFPYMVSTAPTSTGRALSLLSSKTDITNNWVPPNNTDLSSRSSAALRELIAENRAAILARQLILDGKDSWHPSQHQHQHQHQQHQHQHQHQHHHLATEDFGASTSLVESNQQQMFPEPLPPQHGWERANEVGCGGGGGAHVTLDLMQAPSPTPFGFLPGARAKTKAAEEDCCDLWNSF